MTFLKAYWVVIAALIFYGKTTTIPQFKGTPTILRIDLRGKFSFASPGVYETFTTGSSTYGLRVSYPPDYFSDPTKKHPTIVAILGSGEVGTDPTETYKYGPNWALFTGWDGVVTLGDSTWRPLIITVQPPTVTTNRLNLLTAIDTIKARYRVDTMRLYGTGLSMGGQMFNQALMYYGPPGTTNFAVNKQYTAVVIFSTPFPSGSSMSVDSIRQYSRYGGHYWYAIGRDDNPGYIQPSNLLPANNFYPNTIRAFRYTTPDGSGHCCWNTFYNPAWTDTLLGLNIYQYMFQYTKYPKASAQTTVMTNLTSVTLNGVTSGWGKVISWTQLTGAASTITAPSSDTTNVTGLVSGTYTYRLRSRNGTGPTFADHIVTVVVNTNPNTPAGQFPKKKYQKYKMQQI